MGPIDDLLATLSSAQGYADRPFVTLSYAQSLDGSLTLERGRPLRISGHETMRLTHRLRAVHDAILVGIGTVLSDNPRLTVREVPGKNPHAVVLDPQLHLPLDSNLVLTPERRVTVLTGRAANADAVVALETVGVQVVLMNVDEHGCIPLIPALCAIREMGIQRLMVEGGARVITSFLTGKLVDEVVLTIAPVFVGGQRALEEPVVLGSHALPRLEGGGIQDLGGDIVVWGKFTP